MKLETLSDTATFGVLGWSDTYTATYSIAYLSQSSPFVSARMTFLPQGPFAITPAGTVGLRGAGN